MKSARPSSCTTGACCARWAGCKGYFIVCLIRWIVPTSSLLLGILTSNSRLINAFCHFVRTSSPHFFLTWQMHNGGMDHCNLLEKWGGECDHTMSTALGAIAATRDIPVTRGCHLPGQVWKCGGGLKV